MLKERMVLTFFSHLKLNDLPIALEINGDALSSAKNARADPKLTLKL
jgi:hypothetical protein